MKPRDRVLAAIKHKKPDRTPRGEIYIDDAVVRSLRRIIEAHGGSVGVETAPGQGTTFSFVLPA